MELRYFFYRKLIYSPENEIYMDILADYKSKAPAEQDCFTKLKIPPGFSETK